MRYTFDDNQQANEVIHAHQQLIAQAIVAALPHGVLAAIVMIGGYGRSEGGYVFASDGTCQPYNDYDYFLVFDGVSRARVKRLVAALPCLDDAVGIEVDFFPMLKQDLPSLDYSLMHAEMQSGHRVIWGDPDILLSMQAMPLGDVSLGEFTRMMTNRGCLLLLNHLEPGRAELSKYINKNYLAIGDVYLALANQYSLHYSDKRHSVHHLPIENRLADNFNRAIDIRFRPDEGITWRLADLSCVTADWLQAFAGLESRRLCLSIGDEANGSDKRSAKSGRGLGWKAYASSSLAKNQGCQQPVKNMLRHLRHRRACLSGASVLRHPREQIVSQLPLLLAQAVSNKTEQQSSEWRGRASALLGLWSLYS
ncbi:MAG: hypothetical protein ACI9SB_002066 [Candidatus Azotimanducaceae bacterium]|jgi:hypothetical protein